jgi:hypothetical protein
MEESPSSPDNMSAFNSGIRIADYVGILEGQAIDHMMKREMFEWYQTIEGLLSIGATKFKKEETEEFNKELLKLDPHDLKNFEAMKRFMFVLNRHLDKYGFLTPKGDNPRQAVYR